MPIFSASAAQKSAKPLATPQSGASDNRTNEVSAQKNISEVTPQGKVKSRRVAVRGSIATPSIANALKGHISSPESKKAEPQKVKPVAEPVSHSFTEEQLVRAWKEFVVKVEAPQLNAALSSREPSLKGEWNVIYMLDNETQRERLVYEVKPKLLGFLRRTLRNERIEVEFQIAEGDDALPRKPYSDSEKWQAMVDVNPSLVMFKKMFGLDFDN